MNSPVMSCTHDYTTSAWNENTKVIFAAYDRKQEKKCQVKIFVLLNWFTASCRR